MSNGFTDSKRWVDEIERHNATLETYKAEYMNRCKAVQEQKTQCFDLAKDAGIPKGELKAVIKVRQLEKKIAKVRDDLEDDQQETFYMIRHALGDLADLPLGRSALDKSEALDSLTDDNDDVDVRPAFLREKDGEHPDAQRVRDGISPLN